MVELGDEHGFAVGEVGQLLDEPTQGARRDVPDELDLVVAGLVEPMIPSALATAAVTGETAHVGTWRLNRSIGSHTTVPARASAVWTRMGASSRKSAPIDDMFLLNFWCMALCRGT